jgi:hypothetical protein
LARAHKKKVQQGTLVQPEISIVNETVPQQVEVKRTVDVVSVLISIAIGIIIATFLFFLFSKLGLVLVIKTWFFVVVFLCLSLALSLLLYPVLGTNLLNILPQECFSCTTRSCTFIAPLNFLQNNQKKSFNSQSNRSSNLSGTGHYFFTASQCHDCSNFTDRDIDL